MAQGFEGLAYRGAPDFVLKHGRFFEPKPKPAAYPKMAPKMCFGNSILIAARYGLRYVEGYACAKAATMLPIMHAWNIDDDGSLVDTTWGDQGAAYMGVIFAVERADDATWEGDASILDDYKRGWPIFRQPWTGEHTWPDSDRLRICREGSAEEIAAFFELAGQRSETWRASTEARR